MGIEIYYDKQRKEYIKTIQSTKSIASAIDYLEKQTGLTIDEYADTVLSKDHMVLILSKIDKNNEWRSLFEAAVEKGLNLYLYGD